KIESRRPHADNRESFGGEDDGFPQNIRISLERGTPHYVAKYSNVCAGRVFFFSKRSPDSGTHPKGAEIVRRERVANDKFRLSGIGEGHFVVIGSGDILEHVVLLPPIGEVSRRNRKLLIAACGVPSPNHHQTIGIAIRRRGEQNRVDDGKYRGVR